MTKNTFQDITPPEKRSIRDIPLPLRKTQAPVPTPTPTYEYVPEKSSKKRSYGKVLIVLIVLAVLLGLIFFSTSLFSGATVRVTPHTSVASFDAHLSASRETGAEGLHYDLITVEKEGKKTVEASTTSTVSRKSVGKIIIYNNFSAEAQTLVSNTRFASGDGLIFRADKAVTIPGKVGTTPGSIEVAVTADEAGDKYNISQSDFTIPGFKSDAARYTGFYGRSKTAFSGGFVGVSAVLSDQDRNDALTSLENELRESLQKEIMSQKPDTFILYKEGIIGVRENLPDELIGSDKNQVAVREKVTLFGIIFNKEELGKYVASHSTFAGETESGDLDVANLEALSFALTNKPSVNATSSTHIEFTLKGSPVILSHIDIDKLRGDLAGKTVKSAQHLLSTAYPTIEKMEFIIRPFWKNTLPSDPDQMVIDIITP